MLPDGVALDYSFDPLEALRRWPVDRGVVMLHSGRLDERWSRYSVLAEPVAALVYREGQSRWIGGQPHRPAVDVQLRHDPFGDLDRVVESDPGTMYIGHLNYDLARVIENLPERATDDHGWPDLQFHRCPNYLVFDHSERSWRAVGPSPQRLPDLSTAWRAEGGSDRLSFTAGQAKPDSPRAAHEANVQRALDYIAAGDLFQVNLAQRFSASFQGSTRGLFLGLAEASPAWYGAYLELMSRESDNPPGAVRHAMCSTSPELFLQLDREGRVTTRPIKGTRPASVHPEELLHAEKDTAELNMIIDLLRNDLGRVCDYGSVRVSQPRTVESHPTVHHGVATVAGKLHDSRSLRHLLRATFPGGSITGAPKVRAMQVIEELEAVRRGPYCGAMGYVLNDGGQTTARLNIAIRTLLIDSREAKAQFSVGGGIVADSQPVAEYEETIDKAAAMLAALNSSGAGR